MIENWEDEARRLRAAGMSWENISREVGVTTTKVRRCVDQAFLARERKRAASRSRALSIEFPVRPGPGASFVDTWQRKDRAPRPIAGVINPTISSAAAAFARGEIDRGELMRRIQGQGGDQCQ